jgi:hypothetical protein
MIHIYNGYQLKSLGLLVIVITVYFGLLTMGCAKESDSVSGSKYDVVTLNENLPYVLCEDIWWFTVEAGTFTATVVPTALLDVRLVMFGPTGEVFYVDSSDRGYTETGSAEISSRQTLHIQVGSVHGDGSYELTLSSDGPISDVRLVHDDVVCHYGTG